MRTILCALSIFLTLALAIPAQATNGDNLIGVGKASRAMGGVGIAAPQDAVGAVFANPAAMCFGSFCPSSQLDLSMTLFKPEVEAEVTKTDGHYSGNSAEKTYPIPALGFSMPLSDRMPLWRFGIAAYGVSGMGVNYRGTDLDGPDNVGFGFPHIAGNFTELQRMKLAPAISVQVYDWLSLGLAAHIHYASLDLGNGPEDGMTLGVQPGIIIKPNDEFSIGLTYISPQRIKHDNVSDFDGDGEKDALKLEAPQSFGLGVAYQPSLRFLVEADVKWHNWGDAEGYKDFGWDDQWVFNVGMQYRATDTLTLRCGYNFAENPVSTSDGFTGSELIEVQGKSMPRYFYETFRLIGFPAIVEQHVTLGLAWQVMDNLNVNLTYMHAFEQDISTDGTDLYGSPTSITSRLSEDSLGFGISWVF